MTYPGQPVTDPTPANTYGSTLGRTIRTADTLRVFTGTPAPTDQFLGPGSNGEVPMSAAQGTASIADLASNLYHYDTPELLAFQKSLYQGGLLAKGDISGTVDQPTLDGFTRLLSAANLYYEQGINVTWQDLLARRTKIIDKLGGPGPGGGGISTSTSTRIDLTDPVTAGVLADKTLEQHLGRAANAAERAQFTQALQSYERGNPSVSTTSIDRTTGQVTRSTETSRAVDPTAFAEAYTHSTQAMANETGTQNEIGFVSVLDRLMRGGG